MSDVTTSTAGSEHPRPLPPTALSAAAATASSSAAPPTGLRPSPHSLRRHHEFDESSGRDVSPADSELLRRHHELHDDSGVGGAASVGTLRRHHEYHDVGGASASASTPCLQIDPADTTAALQSLPPGAGALCLGSERGACFSFATEAEALAAAARLRQLHIRSKLVSHSLKPPDPSKVPLPTFGTGRRCAAADPYVSSPTTRPRTFADAAEASAGTDGDAASATVTLGGAVDGGVYASEEVGRSACAGPSVSEAVRSNSAVIAAVMRGVERVASIEQIDAVGSATLTAADLQDEEMLRELQSIDDIQRRELLEPDGESGAGGVDRDRSRSSAPRVCRVELLPATPRSVAVRLTPIDRGAGSPPAPASAASSGIVDGHTTGNTQAREDDATVAELLTEPFDVQVVDRQGGSHTASTSRDDELLGLLTTLRDQICDSDFVATHPPLVAGPAAAAAAVSDDDDEGEALELELVGETGGDALSGELAPLMRVLHRQLQAGGLEGHPPPADANNGALRHRGPPVASALPPPPPPPSQHPMPPPPLPPPPPQQFLDAQEASSGIESQPTADSGAGLGPVNPASQHLQALLGIGGATAPPPPFAAPPGPINEGQSADATDDLAMFSQQTRQWHVSENRPLR